MNIEVNFDSMGGGEPNYTTVINTTTTVGSGTFTLTINELSTIKAAFFRYRTQPQTFWGYAVLDGDTYTIYNDYGNTHGISAVNGNVISIVWQGSSDILDFFVLGM